MKYYLAVFSSITFANKIRKLLLGTPGFIALMHTPSSLSEKGCSYSLRFREEKLKDIENVASKHKIKIHAIYLEENGKYEKIK